VRYEGQIYRPPSEHDAYLLQATIGCSWNHCTYCAMYIDKVYRVRELSETLADLRAAGAILGPRVTKLFVTDGDAMGMPMEGWRAVLRAARELLPNLRRVSCYATARNLLNRDEAELSELASLGLRRLYIGPESGDDVTLKRIAKGASFEEHVLAAQRAHAAGMELSVITLLGAGGVERSQEHAEATARLVTGMDPAWLSALTLTVLPNTPLHRLQTSGRFSLPEPHQLLGELRTLIAQSQPTRAVFRTNHASNYLPLGGELPHDRERLLATLDAALAGRLRLRPESQRGL
jgi:radical SAM superfamily enzyme YgiQ (UPF0313 family)